MMRFDFAVEKERKKKKKKKFTSENPESCALWGNDGGWVGKRVIEYVRSNKRKKAWMRCFGNC